MSCEERLEGARLSQLWGDVTAAPSACGEVTEEAVGLFTAVQCTGETTGTG